MTEGRIGVSTDPEKSKSCLEEVFKGIRNWVILGGPYTENKANAVKTRLLLGSRFKEHQNNEHTQDENADWYVYYFEHFEKEEGVLTSIRPAE